jgi:hypothetical protein
LNLVLVCRSWRQMATELLYQNVYIFQTYDRQRPIPIKAFRWTLETTTGAYGSKNLTRKKRRPKDGQAHEGYNGMPSHSEPGYGRWVKQLELDVDYVSVEDVAAIVCCCPNLRTLIIQKINSWNQRKVKTIFLRAIPMELQRMELLYSTRVLPSTMSEEFSAILNKRPSIKVASLSCGFIHFGHGFLPLSQLRVLTLIEPNTQHLRALRKWELPSLTHLSLHRTILVSELQSVIQHFGPQLIFLDVRPKPTWWNKSIFPQYCSSILSSCPRLRGFVLHDEDILPHQLRSQSLTHLIIITYNGWVSLQMDKVLASEFPALTCVRILREWDSDHPLVPPDSSEDWVAECRARGVRVEDKDGMDLLGPLIIESTSRRTSRLLIWTSYLGFGYGRVP